VSARLPRGQGRPGWFFIGREPLSTFARGWNVLLLLGILATVGIVQYGSYTSTPAYKARQQMAAAHKQAGQGQLAQAARTYQGLAIAGGAESENAGKALAELLDNECQNAPLSESGGVFAAAAQVARRDNAPWCPMGKAIARPMWPTRG